MIPEKIDGQLLKDMIIAGGNLLEKNKKIVDSLNVFPVPDGDTGTNMSLTMMSAVREVRSNDSKSVSEIAEAVARGALKGARGNSGVILSQLFRGFAKGVKGHAEINGYQFAQGLKSGVETAYKAVMKPTEGTILTVARLSADEGLAYGRKEPDPLSVMKAVFEAAERALNKTPEMLPVLKQAGVVDAGGKGLLFIYLGFKAAMDGVELFTDMQLIDDAPENIVAKPHLEGLDDIKYGYCTEFFIRNLYPQVTEHEIDRLREKLSKIGDSLIAVGDRELIKIHVHTNVPGKALQYALRLGELSSIKIDNMREQHRHVLEESSESKEYGEPSKEYGMISVAAGEGLSRIFKDLMVDQIIEGGQTMNPSTEDILNAIEKTPASKIFVLPNNSNIILAAEQAVNLTEKKVVVIPSKSIPQGLAAVLSFNPEGDFEDNKNKMMQAIGQVKTGQVTYAVRSSNFDGKDIREGDIIGLANGKITQVDKDVFQVSLGVLKDLADDQTEIITVFYGKDVTEESAQQLSEHIQKEFPQCDVELHEGGQPLYYYIFSVE